MSDRPWYSGKFGNYCFYADDYFIREDFSKFARIILKTDEKTIDDAIWSLRCSYNFEVGQLPPDVDVEEFPQKDLEEAGRLMYEQIHSLKVGMIIATRKYIEGDPFFDQSVILLTDCTRTNFLYGKHITKDRINEKYRPVWSLSKLVGEILLGTWDLYTPGEAEAYIANRRNLVADFSRYIDRCYEGRV
jgi:hypothetical protein